jgi:hypothetical protein
MIKKKSIKDFLPPQLGKKIKQDYYIPKNLNKYIGDSSKVIYRSSWEKKFMEYCDFTSAILKWGNEPTGIPYFNPITKKMSTYWIDFYIATRTDSNQIQEWLIEIKPNKYINPPNEPKNLNEKVILNYAKHSKAYIINSAKFSAAIPFP